MKSLAAVLVLTLATPVFAQDVAEEDVDRFIAAIVENGCSMTEDEAKELMPMAGISKETSRAITELLVEDGRAIPAEGEYRLTLAPELCG